MAFYTAQEVRGSGFGRVAASGALSADQALRELSRPRPGVRFDIFLSHSFRDAVIILGIVQL
ncbi:hypothetical protein, partial [Mycolicibacterium sp. XJ1819]